MQSFENMLFSHGTDNIKLINVDYKKHVQLSIWARFCPRTSFLVRRVKWNDTYQHVSETSFSTVFQSYQDGGRVIMKSCMQWSLVYDGRRFPPLAGIEPVGQRNLLSYGAPLIFRYLVLKRVKTKLGFISHIGSFLPWRCQGNRFGCFISTSF